MCCPFSPRLLEVAITELAAVVVVAAAGNVKEVDAEVSVV